MGLLSKRLALLRFRRAARCRSSTTREVMCPPDVCLFELWVLQQRLPRCWGCPRPPRSLGTTPTATSTKAATVSGPRPSTSNGLRRGTRSGRRPSMRSGRRRSTSTRPRAPKPPAPKPITPAPAGARARRHPRRHLRRPRPLRLRRPAPAPDAGARARAEAGTPPAETPAAPVVELGIPVAPAPAPAPVPETPEVQEERGVLGKVGTRKEAVKPDAGTRGGPTTPGRVLPGRRGRHRAPPPPASTATCR